MGKRFVFATGLASLLGGAFWAAVAVPKTLRPPAGTQTKLLFDGVCNLCNGFVNFVADHNEARDIFFGPQQKHMELLQELGAPTDLSTLVMVQNDKVFTYSDAALRTVALLDPPYNG